MESIDNLSKKLLKEYGDRKRKGRLDLVYDIETEEFYPVPKDIEHKEFMPQIKEFNWKSLIPVQFRMYVENSKRLINYLGVGASSFENDCGVRHPQAYLKEAYEKAFELINKNTHFEIAPEAKLEIKQKFAERS